MESKTTNSTANHNSSEEHIAQQPGESTTPVRRYITYPHFNGTKTQGETNPTEKEGQIIEKNSEKHNSSNDAEF